MAVRLFQKSAKNPKSTQTSEAKERALRPQSGQAAAATGSGLLLRPHITEKATDLAKKNQYVFVVGSDANKTEVARQVELAYGVSVEAVRMVNVHPKRMRLGRTKGIKKGYKKALVAIQEGEKIEILPT